MNTAFPAADWYPDPGDPSAVRWWDGRAWTHHQAARTAPPPARRESGPPARRESRRRRAQAPLDRTQAELRRVSPQPWGALPVALPLIALVGLIGLGLVAGATITPHGGTARTLFAVLANVLVDGLLGWSVWRAGRAVAARNGGWAVTFGLRRPRWIDLAWAAAGIGITFVARGVVVVIANGLTHGRAARQAQNLHLHHVDAATVVALVIAVALVAPFIEELVFRGLLLRTFMRRMGFWPAAILSTVIFAGLHTYEVSTLVGALTLAASVGGLGLTNCWLNRRTDSLVAGMIVHGTFNLLAVIVLAVQAR